MATSSAWQGPVITPIFSIGIFDPTLGGDPVLFQHFFWFYSHPAVYIMVVPAMGIVSEVIATFSQKTIFGYKAIAFSSIGIAAISFLVWGHHMYTAGMSGEARWFFSFLTFIVAIPFLIVTSSYRITVLAFFGKTAPVITSIQFLEL